MTAAELDGVTKRYGSTVVLDNISLTIEHGEIVAMIGRSGSGKSTILRLLAGLSDDHDGTVTTTGRAAVAFQEPRLFPWRRVRNNVAYGLAGAKLPAAEALRRADATLAEVGLGDKGDAWPLTLSGGQAQRAALARALVGDPELVLLDEPFGALDALTKLTMHELLLTLWRQHRFGLLLVTHDVDEAVALADRVIVLSGGECIAEHTITQPRPRDRAHPAFAESRSLLLRLLGLH